MTKQVNKKVSFMMSESQKVDFKIRLQYDGLTQTKFFKYIVDAYIEKDEDLYRFINKFKKDKSVQTVQERKTIKKNFEAAKETKKSFLLGDEEVENIFDILEKEHPDL
jgi:hypothetical protein